MPTRLAGDGRLYDPVMRPALTEWLRASSLVLVVPLIVACGATPTSATGDAQPATAEPAGGDSNCPDLQEMPENLTAEQPFGTVNAECEVVPYVNPAKAVECATVWQVGARLPDDYSGCNTPAWPWCDDPRLQNAWKYKDMYAEAGTLIVRGKRHGPDNSPC